MNYQEAVFELEQREHFGMKLGLENITKLCEKLENPQHSFKVVHVAGSNGKGSVVSMCHAILNETGVSVGMHTSPHLQSVRERFVINGTLISQEDFVEVYQEVKKAVDTIEREGFQVTYFEFVTAMAFVYFRGRVDWGVIEVGMGGRLDATSVVTPVVAAITTIDLEHTQHLGDTKEKIAFEKAGIIKNGCTVVIGEYDHALQQQFKKICEERGSKCVVVQGEYSGTIGLAGQHQKRNAKIAIDVVKQLPLMISEDHIRKGLEKVQWHARLEKMQDDPLVILDGSHTPQGMETIVAYLQQLKEKPLLVVGFSEEKNVAEMAKIAQFARKVIVTKAAYKGMDMKVVANEIRKYCSDVSMIKPVIHAVETAMKLNRTTIITGSLYVAGEARNYWEKIE